MIRAHRRSAFTLVELLVVIGIIAILISILLPVVNKAREQANRVKCLSNVRQLAIAAISYANDNKGIFPVEAQWRLLPIPTGKYYPIFDVFRADMYTLMHFGTPGLAPATSRPDKLWQCPSTEDRWTVYTGLSTSLISAPSNSDVIRSTYLYLGAGLKVPTSPTNLDGSYQLDPTRRYRRLGQKSNYGGAVPLFADENSYTENSSGALGVDVAGWRINHPMGTAVKKNTVTTATEGYAAGSNEAFTDGHGEWVTNITSTSSYAPLRIGKGSMIYSTTITFRPPFIINNTGNGNAAAMQSDQNTPALMVESYWW